MKNLYKVLLCEPKYFEVSYEINPWMNLKVQPDKYEALKQWEQLRIAISKAGAVIYSIEPQPGLPDMVFTGNGGVCFNKRVILPKFRHPERQGEETFWRERFETLGYETIEPLHHFEGAGDVLWNGRTMFCGYGFRSDMMAHNRVIYELLVCTGFRNEGSRVQGRADNACLVKLINPLFYHLDTCFCPLDQDTAIYAPNAIDPESLESIKKYTSIIEVDEDEASHFCCNTVVLGKSAIMPDECPKTGDLLEGLGFTVHHVPMSQFIKSGGACKCLTLTI